MKRVLPLCALLLLPALAPAAEQNRDADHEQLRALMKMAREAVNNQDLDALFRLLAPGFAVTMADQTLITSRDSLDSYFKQLFTGEDALLQDIAVIPEADVVTDFTGEDSGVNYGSSVDTYTLKGGREVTLNSRWSASMVKVGGEWKIKTFHAGVNMIDNPILAAVKQTTYFWGGGGLVLGLVLGVLFGRRRRAAH